MHFEVSTWDQGNLYHISMFCSSEISLTDFYGIIYTHVEAHSHNSKLNLDFHGNYTGIYSALRRS